MKTKILLCLMVLGITNAMAFDKKKPVKDYNASSTSVIEGFEEAKSTYNAKLLDVLLDDNVIIKTGRETGVLKHSKAEMVRFFKKNGTIQLNCTVSHHLLSVCDRVVMARVDFQFPEFVQQNYVTMEMNMEGRWKIVQITTFSV